MRISAAAMLFGSTLLALGCGGEPAIDPDIVIEGRWVGDLESGFLPSGSSLVVIEIVRARAGEPVVARLTFGEGAAPAAPTNPSIGWPAGLDPQMASAVPVADGFVYPSTRGTRAVNRVHIDVAVTELWAPWCALQTPYPIVTAGSDEYQCLPNREWVATPFDCHFVADATNPELPVDCLQLTLCRRTRVCMCTPASCTPSDELTLYVELAVTGDTALGSIVWPTGVARVRLTRS